MPATFDFEDRSKLKSRYFNKSHPFFSPACKAWSSDGVYSAVYASLAHFQIAATSQAKMLIDADSETERSLNTDLQLASDLAAHSESAMQALIDRYGQRLRTTIGRLTAWGPDVDDLLQETLVRAWIRAAEYRGEGDLEKWLVSIAFRCCRDHQRSARRYWIRLMAWWSQQPGHDRTSGVGDESIATEEWDLLQQAMMKLSDSDRQLLVMIHIEHWNPEEVASQLAIRLETLHVRLHRARNRLQEVLKLP